MFLNINVSKTNFKIFSHLMYGCKSLNAHALYLGYKTIQNKAVLQNDKALFLWEMFWWSSIFFYQIHCGWYKYS